ncbi:MAG TPA: cytochrome c maturation protein CcmE [Bacteroidia bacterium]|jgi:cytochrome c-type biogenesis protein CcmE
MKKSHIIGIIVIAITIGVMVVALMDANTYANFETADKNPGTEYHVAGRLDRDKEMVYDPVKDPNIFTFYMKDTLGVEKRVVLHKAKPQDFDHSEQLVLIGKSNGSDFEANDILMKCPSKYNDGKPVTTENK